MKSVGPSLAPTNAKGIFVVADVTIKNKGKEALTIDSSMFKLKSGDKTFEADNTGSMSANQSDNGSIENSFFLQRINPDSTAQGKIVFDVSENIANAKDKKLEVISSLFSVKKITFDLSDAKKTSKAKKDKQDTEVAVASSNSDNVSYELRLLHLLQLLVRILILKIAKSLVKMRISRMRLKVINLV